MRTVIDQQSPWLTPRRTFAARTSHQCGAGANMRMNGTGRPTTHPARSTRRRPADAAQLPAKRFVIAFARPNVATKESTAALDPRRKTCSPRSGTRVRSEPTVAPTKALRRMSRTNSRRLAPRPTAVGGGITACDPSGPLDGEARLGPGGEAALDLVQVAVSAPCQDGNPRHGAPARRACHGDGTLRREREVLPGEPPVLHVRRARDVPALPLLVEADVEDDRGVARGEALSELTRVEGGNGPHGEPRGPPRRHPAPEVPAKVVVSDPEDLAHGVVELLRG